MPDDLKKVLLFLPLVVLLAVVSYHQFFRYQPKVIRRIEEVRGKKTSSDKELTYPLGVKNISFNETTSKIQATFQTDKAPEDIQSFYESIFSEKEWELDSVGEENGFYIARYKKADRQATVLASLQGIRDETIVSIEVETD